MLERVRAYWRKSAQIGPQHQGVVASARNAAHDFAVPCTERCVYFGCEPGLAFATGTRVDFAGLVACGRSEDTGPRFVLYQPARDGADSLVAACLKAQFFESVFLDADRRTGRPDLPIAAYVADEAHRYLTSDSLHGEANFLDSARSFGCVAVLATQSLASVEHALAQGGGSATERRAALEIVWTNTGTKLAFRTTDERTSERVQNLTPYRPGYAPITRVRPLSALSPGGCYAFLPDGSFRLAQLDPFDPAVLGRERSRAVDPVFASRLREARRRKKRKRKHVRWQRRSERSRTDKSGSGRTPQSGFGRTSHEVSS